MVKARNVLVRQLRFGLKIFPDIFPCPSWKVWRENAGKFGGGWRGVHWVFMKGMVAVLVNRSQQMGDEGRGDAVRRVYESRESVQELVDDLVIVEKDRRARDQI